MEYVAVSMKSEILLSVNCRTRAILHHDGIYYISIFVFRAPGLANLHQFEGCRKKTRSNPERR